MMAADLDSGECRDDLLDLLDVDLSPPESPEHFAEATQPAGASSRAAAAGVTSSQVPLGNEGEAAPVAAGGAAGAEAAPEGSGSLAAGPAPAAPAAASQDSAAGRRRGLVGWAAKLGKKAVQLGETATKAIQAEAQSVAKDVQELNQAMRSNVLDSKILQEKLARETKNLAGLFAPPRREKADSTAAPSGTLPTGGTASASECVGHRDVEGGGAGGSSDEGAKKRSFGIDMLDGIRQGLAATAEVSSQMIRDLRETNLEVAPRAATPEERKAASGRR